VYGSQRQWAEALSGQWPPAFLANKFSFSSSPFVSLFHHCHCSFDILTTPHQDIVDPFPSMSSWLSFAFLDVHIEIFDPSLGRRIEG